MHNLEDRLNNLPVEAIPTDPLLLCNYTDAVYNSLKRNITPIEEYTGLRLSQIGKPGVLQALWSLGFPHSGGLAIKHRLTFHSGDVFEALLVLLLQAAGYEILDWNNNNIYTGVDPVTEDKYVEFEGVRGHTDIVVRDTVDNSVFIIEAKTSNDRYFTSFMKKPDDERGYVSQLALYQKSLDLPGCWVFFNKNTSEFGVQFLPEDLKESALARAHVLIPILRDIKKWDNLVDSVANGVLQAPPPINEVFQRKQTGALLVPQSMKYSPYRHCFYDIIVETNGYLKPTEYVVGVKQKIVHPSEL